MRIDHRACHPATRRALLEEIDTWAEQSTDKGIFWLNGMAGTGKSTVAYTLDERLDRQRSSSRVHLGASFFFNRGQRDRASAALFSPTIVRQLRQKIPNLAAHIDQAIDHDLDICLKFLGKHFDEIVEKPLQRLNESPLRSQFVVVVDA
ncbi:hypothetical protein LTS08_008741 [Lithohypha guttulata]|uniref:Nephrocystin 3-like N-terminal domain-containing protein n=1 Tax=Lithohypha guttulata TaxID=1690604 RepID=A0AAN7PJE5_9EURO|nr:hypothetical protein LTR05_008798 [Lithohypha guttulata]KAK5094082.1 hypothetical protein LTS08_008741 [Lithohypha guttulata]